MIKGLILVAMVFIMSGCSVYGDRFSCSPGKGVPCKSISQINEMVSRGDIEENNSIDKASKNTARDRKRDLPSLSYSAKKELSSNNKAEQIVRVPEKTARVWLNSFVDEQGDYVSDTLVYVVVKPGVWEVR